MYKWFGMGKAENSKVKMSRAKISSAAATEEYCTMRRYRYLSKLLFHIPSALRSLNFPSLNRIHFHFNEMTQKIEMRSCFCSSRTAEQQQPHKTHHEKFFFVRWIVSSSSYCSSLWAYLYLRNICSSVGCWAVARYIYYGVYFKFDHLIFI